MQNFQGIIFILIRTYEEIFKSALAICKSRNGESGNGIRGMMGTWGIRAGTQGIRVILCENLRVCCFG